MKPVLEGRYLRLLWSEDRPGDRLYVTFDHWKRVKPGFEPLSGDTLFDRRGWPVLRVQTARNDWFLNPDLEAALDVVAAIAGDYANVVTYGFSMGGYGALRFAEAAGACRVVAISPQATPIPARAPFETRWWKDRQQCDAALDDLSHMSRAGAPRVVMLYDPMQRPDRLQAELVRAHCNDVLALPLAFGGHPATQTILQGGRLGEFAAALLNDPLDRHRLLQVHKRARRQAEGYREALERAQVSRRLRAPA